MEEESRGGPRRMREGVEVKRGTRARVRERVKRSISDDHPRVLFREKDIETERKMDRKDVRLESELSGTVADVESPDPRGLTEFDKFHLVVFGNDGERRRSEFVRPRLEDVEAFLWLLDRERRHSRLFRRRRRRGAIQESLISATSRARAKE